MNRDKKLILPCILIACAIITALLLGTLITTERGSAGENVSWTLTAGGKLKAEGSGAIADHTFAKNDTAVFYHKSVTRAALGEGITRIGNEAFYECYNMRTVSIPASVIEIGSRAFHGCDKLASVRLPEDANFVYENGALYTKDGKTLLFVSPKKSGKEFTVPAGVETIAEEAFYGCSRITSLTLPDTLKEIGKGAFHGCSGLSSITPGAGFAFEDGALYTADRTALIVLLPKAGKTELTVPEGVMRIADEAFYGCKALTEISLPSTLAALGDGVFCGCTALENITLKNDGAFVFENGALYNAEKTALLVYLSGTAAESFTVPESVTVIAPKAFYGCKTMEELTLPGVTEIGAFAFTNCSGLEKLTFGASETAWRALLDGTYTGLVENKVEVSCN